MSLGSQTAKSWFRVGSEHPTSNLEAVVGRTDDINPSRRLRAPKRVSQRAPPRLQTAGESRRCPPQRQQARAAKFSTGVMITAPAPKRSRYTPNAPRHHIPHLRSSPRKGRHTSTAPSRNFQAAGHHAHHMTPTPPHPDHEGTIPTT